MIVSGAAFCLMEKVCLDGVAHRRQPTKVHNTKNVRTMSISKALYFRALRELKYNKENGGASVSEQRCLLSTRQKSPVSVN